jgi:hypothetical protein
VPVFRWTLFDPVVPESYTFAINPHDSSPQPMQKNVAYYATVADDGATVFFEGQDVPQQATFTGSCLTEDHYNQLVYWYSKRRQVLLTDDLGNQKWIYFVLFTPTRKYGVNYPWGFDILMQYYIFGQQGVPTL